MSDKSYLSYISSPKVTAGLLVVLGTGAIFFGLGSWQKSFKYGLLYNDANKLSQQGNNNDLQVSNLSVDDNKVDFSDPKLKVKDTDSDGLNDWDELNVYKTSPYINDSDSDGISDGDEIKRNSDPLCAEGANCLSYENDLKTINNSSGIEDIGQAPTSTIDINALESIPVNELRNLLKSAGYTEEQLGQLTDDQLSQLWQQALQDLTNKTKN